TADEVVLEPDLPFAGDRDARLDGVIAHGKHASPNAPRRRYLTCHAGQRRSIPPTLRAVQMGGEVAIAQAEPGRAAVALEGLDHRPALARQAPSRLLVDGAAERVDDGVEIGTDVEAVKDDVVARVHHGRHAFGRDDLDQAPEEAG